MADDDIESAATAADQVVLGRGVAVVGALIAEHCHGGGFGGKHDRGPGLAVDHFGDVVFDTGVVADSETNIIHHNKIAEAFLLIRQF